MPSDTSNIPIRNALTKGYLKSYVLVVFGVVLTYVGGVHVGGLFDPSVRVGHVPIQLIVREIVIWGGIGLAGLISTLVGGTTIIQRAILEISNR